MSLDLYSSGFRTLAQPIYMGGHKLNAIYMGNIRVYPSSSGIWANNTWIGAPTYRKYYDGSYHTICAIDTACIWTDGVNIYAGIGDEDSDDYGEAGYFWAGYQCIFNKVSKSWSRVGFSYPSAVSEYWALMDEDIHVFIPNIWSYNGRIYHDDVYTLTWSDDGDYDKYLYAGHWVLNPGSRAWSLHEWYDEDGNIFPLIGSKTFVIDGVAYCFLKRQDYGFYRLSGSTWVEDDIPFEDSRVRLDLIDWESSFFTDGYNVYLISNFGSDLGYPTFSCIFDRATHSWKNTTWTYADDAKTKVDYGQSMHHIDGDIIYIVAEDHPKCLILDKSSNVWHDYEFPFDESVSETVKTTYGSSSSGAPGERLFWTDGTDWYYSQWGEAFQLIRL